MSRPYGYLGRPAGTPAVRLTVRGRMLVETLTLVAVVLACWTATLLLPAVAHPTTPTPAPGTGHVHARTLFNPAARIDGTQVENRTRETTR